MKFDHDGLEAASAAFWAKYQERTRKPVDAPDYEPMKAAIAAYADEAGGVVSDIVSGQAIAIFVISIVLLVGVIVY
jgi:hypothetical protein